MNRNDAVCSLDFHGTCGVFTALPNNCDVPFSRCTHVHLCRDDEFHWQRLLSALKQLNCLNARTETKGFPAKCIGWTFQIALG
mmetsp:Transcript_9485/g.35198  ORF Transcript_9485/g.35198 Transcript_9485/m.35198 type:complete len:83 (-) Transcript_9485:864-1112(-)